MCIFGDFYVFFTEKNVQKNKKSIKHSLYTNETIFFKAIFSILIYEYNQN